MSQPATLPAPFVFDRDYNNHEQVRHLMPDYLARYAELTRAGRYPYNDEFKQLPCLATTDDKNQDTAIYLMQNLRRIDEENAREADFLADGGRVVDPAEFDANPDLILRGTFVHRNVYSGNHGWREYEAARLIRDGRTFVVIPKGKRNGHILGYGARILHRPATKARR